MIRALIKKTAGLSGPGKIIRYVTRFNPRILMYHGLTENPTTREWTQVAIDTFKEQMQYLRQFFHPVSLREMVAMLESGKIEPHAVTVTFDDGYKSNYDLAYPILKELGIPATIFITSRFVMPQSNRYLYLWPDLISVILKSHAPTAIDLDDLSLGQYNLSSERNIYSAHNEICERLKSVASTDNENVVAALYERFGDTIDDNRFSDFSPMTPENVRRLAADDLITIGAHSQNHPILSRLEPARLEEEIVGSKRDLEEITGVSISEFAYPNGRWRDINREVVEITARHFECAVLTETGLNLTGHNKYLLRRIGIGSNLDFRQYRAMLSGVYYIGQKPIVRLEEAKND